MKNNYLEQSPSFKAWEVVGVGSGNVVVRRVRTC